MYTYSKLGCNSVYNPTVILSISSLLCCSVFRTYLKEYNPQTARRWRGQSYSRIHTRELNKHYVDFFNLTHEAKLHLAANLGITVDSLRRWMRKKWHEERDLVRVKNRIQTPYKQDHGLNVAGTQ